ncbi:peptidoglycan DD-metalloendopeptidase family protein [Bdellovibrio sp. HCB2-146]|uniref:peptidoglycan DD-metalloendopeptidase family protein n=1 Tax=Bdellovibrio sp. HCB2-146 TaxID=3394362 RepID=UPI0039BD38BD
MGKAGAALLLTFTFSAQTLFAACKDSELKLNWPLSGADGVNWVINNYVDLDPGAGLKDYKGNTGANAKTYNGHNGIDVDLPNFRAMEYGAWTAQAAADGVVIDVQEDLYDRNMEAAPGCGPWNHVYVKHANGFVTWYGHLKWNGAIVKKDDVVTAGQALGYIGSSGCSSTAHLHFEVRDCDNKPVDPFLKNMWISPPVYDTPLKIMDITLRHGAFPEPASNSPPDALLKDPPTNIQTAPAGSRVGIGLSMAGGAPNDRLEMIVRRPNGTVYFQPAAIVLSAPARHWWPRWWVNLPASMDTGYWKVEFRTNNNLVKEQYFRSKVTRDMVVTANADVTYQQTFLSLSGDQFTPIFVDGSASPEGGARISAVYRRLGGAFRAIHNADGATYQNFFNQSVAAGLQLTSLDNYVRNGQPLIAAVFSSPVINDWRAYHFLNPEQHQQKFDELRNLGYRPYLMSATIANNRVYLSAAYTKAPSRGWWAVWGMTAQQYQSTMNQQIALGRAPIYVDTYDDGGIPRFSAIWTAEANGWAWEARHGLNEAQMHLVHEERTQAGMRARAITSYMSNGQRLFAAIWSTAP